MRFLLLAILVMVVARALRLLLSGMKQGLAGGGKPRPPAQGVRMVRDPVCGMFIVPSRALVVDDRGQARYFCSEKCRAEYQSRGRSRATSSR